MRYANDLNKTRICADEALRGAAYSCPICGGSLILKRGEVVIPHFAHKRNAPCSDTWTYDESPWAAQWQAKFPEENREPIIISDAQRHRADVCMGNYVLIFQQTTLQPKTFREKTSFFQKAGYKVIWLFDARKEWESKAIRTNPKDRNQYFWNEPYSFLSKLTPQSEKTLAVLLQLTDDKVIKAEWSVSGFKHFIIDKTFSPILTTEEGCQDILRNQYERFDAFRQQNMPWHKKSSNLPNVPKEWHICEKTGAFHIDGCKKCVHNLINEYRTANSFSRGGLFFYCCYPRVIHQDQTQDEDGSATADVPSIWLK